MVLGQYRAVLVGTWWYRVRMGYNLALFGIRWYWVSIGLLSLYMLNKSEILSGVTIAGQQTTNKQGKIELLSQWTMEG